MNTEASKRKLMAVFLNEVQERTRDLERNLLAIETTADPVTRQEVLKALLRMTHSLKGAAGFMEVRPIETACHWMEELFADGTRDGQHFDRRQIGMLLEMTDTMAEYGRLLEQGQRELCARTEERLNGQAETIRTTVQAAHKSEKKHTTKHPRELPGSRIADDAAKEERAAAPPNGVVGSTIQKPVVRSADLDGSAQIPAEKLDSLLLRSGEILVSRSRSRTRIEQAASLRELTSSLRRPFSTVSGSRPFVARTRPPGVVEENDTFIDLENGLRKLEQDLADDSRVLERAAASLEDELHRTRMQPFAQACQGLDRIVRDLSAEQGKSAELTVEGGGVEIDRSILGGLRDVLRHLVRNAVDHGLETPEARAASGKPATGRIVISAMLRGDQIQVRVGDDGSGIDLISLRKHAHDDDRPGEEDEEELLRRIFLPGVSTSAAVTRLSGRGMGLDIVKNAVEKLRGNVHVEHASGKSTAFTLTLPLTVTTIRALLIGVGSQIFALDTINIQKVVQVARDDLRSVNGRSVIAFGDRIIPALDLSGWFGTSVRARRRRADSITVVVIGTAGKETALLVDDLAGEQELMIRALGPRLAKLRNLSGGAILPDGQVALVLNAAGLGEYAIGRNLERDLPPLEEDAPLPARKRILVVDDSLTVRTLEKIILEGAGYQVTTASDGAEAWDVLQADGADALIADVDMPRMDGFLLAEAVRKSQRFKNLPILLVTAREKSQDKIRGLEVGADAYILKSTFDQRQLLELIRQVL
jgi:two-component system chemotaxis sensor kinase CheA